jgi:hypothetical protein
LGEVVGIKTEIWLHLVIGLLGAYLLARHYALDRSAAIMVSFIFMLNSMYALNLTVGMTWFLSVAYLPWIFLFYLKALAHWKYALASGLCLALMFLGGGVYPLSITLLFLSLYSLLLIGFKEHSWHKVSRVLLITLGFMLSIGAAKFIPSIEFMQQHPRIFNDYSGFSLSSLRFGLFSRDQSLDAIEKLPLEEHGFVNGATYAMDENGMYIGVAPFLLFSIGIGPHDKRRRLLFVCLIVFLWISFGNRPRAELWSLLHLLPVYNSMRVAQRFRIIFMLCLAIFAGFGFQTVKHFLQRKTSNPALAGFLTSSILVFVLADLMAVSVPVFKDAFPIPPLPITKSEQFFQVWEFPAYDRNGWTSSTASEVFSSLYPSFLANIGTINGYESADVAREAIPATSAAYQGEVYLLDTAGSAHISDWSPNKITINVDASDEGLLIVNQNYYSGWHVRGGKTDKPENKNGLLAARVSPDDRQIELYYLPTSFVIGLVVTSATILFTVLAYLALPRPIFLWRTNG